MRRTFVLALCASVGCNQLLGIDDPPGAGTGEGTFDVGGVVTERYVDATNDTQSRPAAGATVELVVSDEVVASATTSAQGQYLMTVTRSAPFEATLRARLAGNLETIAFLADPIAADVSSNFPIYSPAYIPAVAAQYAIPHVDGDRYVIVLISTAAAPLAGVQVGATSGVVIYTSATGTIDIGRTSTSTSGIVALFGVKTPSLTISATTASGVYQRTIDLGTIPTASVRIRPD